MDSTDFIPKYSKILGIIGVAPPFTLINYIYTSHFVHTTQYTPYPSR